MTLFPDVQARAHQEIDRVAGTRRFPDFSDQGDMSYIYAVVLESLRWNPPASFSMPEVSYRGRQFTDRCFTGSSRSP